jgi:DNA polymerase bacteriophage-type
MPRLYLDFESYWAEDFTLRKMTPIEYIQSPRFEALGCSFAYGEDDPFWIDGPELPPFLRTVDWHSVFAVSHNALFDMLILALRYSVVPAAYGDTMSMARNWLSHKLNSVSLETLCEYYGMEAKWNTAQKFKGLNLAAIRQDPALYAELTGYACDDTRKCRKIFANMMEEGFPARELETIDMVIRMVTQPKFELDTLVLAEHLGKVRADKQALLDACGIESGDVKSIMSDQQLAVKLLFLGVEEIPMKTSLVTGKRNYAFAKTDKAFTALLEHEKPLVQALVAARIGHKSTIEESRTERLLAVANVTESFPIPLKYSGAHTHRFSGDWKLNVQNLPNGSELRRALKAPKGKIVIAVDASQVEARFNASLSGETQLIEAFKDPKRDVYSEFAAELYGYDNFSRHSKERFVGKTSILSLGYGSAWQVFQNMCRVKGDVKLQDREAVQAVGHYRTRFRRIVDNWNHAQNNILPRLAMGTSSSDELARVITGEAALTSWGPLKILRYAIELPNGNRLQYRNLHQEWHDGRMEWHYLRGKMDQRIYGAKLVENVIQALAFLHIMETALRVKHLTNGFLMPRHQVHDELIYIEDEKDWEWVSQLVVQEMSTSPVWMPDVPLAAEFHIGATYFDAK